LSSIPLSFNPKLLADAHPASDELEISVFGKGIGECVVAHVGNGDWIIIDSFLHDTDPVGRVYLDSLGVPPDKVKCIVVTHWHNDHICGIADLVKFYRFSKVCLPLSLENAEFYKILLRALSPGERKQTSPLREFARMVDALETDGDRESRISYVAHASTLYECASSNVNVKAWSPSSASISHCLHTLLKDLGELMQTCKRARKPNEISVVTSIDDKVSGFLLGGDLEISSNVNMGWLHIVRAQVQPIKSSVFKVPHHGSSTGHEPSVYTNLLNKSPISVVTRYASGKKKLPDDEDIERLKLHASSVFCTAKIGKVRHSQKQKELERMFSNIYKHSQTPSQVRVRTKLRTQQFKVDLFGGATKL
jgi:beta-lactamase superfamily II metal-dependent hydrolase